FQVFYLGIFFMVSGILVFSTKFSREKKEKIRFLDSIHIGLFQACSIVPGISRSGATISGALLTGINKKEAVKYSFFMAIPIILGASIMELGNLNFNEISLFILLISFIITLLVSIFTIKLLMKIINSDKFYIFGVYNFLLGLAIIIFERFFN
ncbi:MAG: undecaprenyl-diphosphate phosphatase, partial [Candidatus Pacearchaeota archaeon]